MDRDGRMMTQRTTITNAVTMARTAVNGVKNTSTDSQVSAAEQAITDLENAIADAEDLPEGDTDVASAQGTLTTLKAQLNTAKTARTVYLATKADEDMKAQVKLGKEMYAALSGPSAGGNTPTNHPLFNIGYDADRLSSAGLAINAALGAGSNTGDPDGGAGITLRAGESAGSLGEWAGTHYAFAGAIDDDARNILDEAVVYTNRAAPTSKTFTEVHGDNALYEPATRTFDVGTGRDTRIESPDFPTSGTKDFGAGMHTVPGTFDGAAGDYKCTGTGTDACTAKLENAGGISLSDAWTFVHDQGAMVSVPDNDYLYFGYWMNKDKDGIVTAASAFYGRVPNLTTAPLADNPNTEITGSATYSGHAAGLYAMDNEKGGNPLDKTGHGGTFTADAKLRADFSTVAVSSDPSGIRGTIDNFRLNGGSENPGWSVELPLRRWTVSSPDEYGIFTSTGTPGDSVHNQLPVWSINGTKAAAAGAWQGRAFDETPGAPPDGDGSNLPTGVVGEFYTEFGDVGRMVGAFGADKQ